MANGGIEVRCVAHSKQTGEQCKRRAKGGTACQVDGGRAPQVESRALVRAEAREWGFCDSTVDPGEVLLRLVTQSAARVQRYANELEALVDESPSLRDALVTDTWVNRPGMSGDSVR